MRATLSAACAIYPPLRLPAALINLTLAWTDDIPPTLPPCHVLHAAGGGLAPPLLSPSKAPSIA